MGIDPYPARSQRSHTNKELLEGFEQLEGQEVTMVGRVMSWREHGKVVFADIQDAHANVQAFIKESDLSDTNVESQLLGWTNLSLLDIGDFIQASGTLVKTQTGQVSVLVKELKILVKTLRPLPEKWHGIQDKEERFRRRYLDMTMDTEVRERFRRRALFWQAHREFFNTRGFSEINIPVLEHIPGGGDAVPFVTHMNAIDEDFYLRISHELPLKRLIGGGFERVYDIGARFRNEGLSDEHLPEHVAMEFYWAYADWQEGMLFIEELFDFILERVYEGKKQFKIRGFDVDFSKGWERIDFAEIMQEKYGIKDIYSVTLAQVKAALDKHAIDYHEESLNVPRGVDTLWKQLRKEVAGPAFLINHPKYLSPLQKASLDNPQMVERFQPIIAGSELGNGWSEVNDAVDQYERFVEQQEMRDAGDDEAQWLDIDYVEMLEYGMAPNFGYGHSERVFWFLEDVTAREGVPFPQLKFHISDDTKKIYPDIDFDSIRD
jgi:lysyl-tRNA synthetase class 2